MEIWKHVDCYQGLYEVSNKGRVRSMSRATTSGGVLNPFIVRGYKCVDLSKDGKSERRKVHRLVALHFVKNPNNYPLVRHKDDDRLNNNAENLAWGTHKHNSEDAIKNGRNARGERMGNAKLTKCDVKSIRKKYNEGNKTLTEIGKEYDIAPSHVCLIVNRSIWTHI